MSLKDRVTKRAILWLLIFVGCGVNYMIRANINIAIVAMVQMTTASDETAVASECIDDEFSLSGNYTLNSNITVPGYNVSTEGLSWPSLNRIVSQWIPPDDRSKFMSSYMGSSIGTAVTFPLCGMLIHYLNWQSVFYVTSVIGIAWFVFWWWLVFDSPAQHPTITQKELAYIRSSLGDSVSERKKFSMLDGQSLIQRLPPTVRGTLIITDHTQFSPDSSGL
ncbi:sialin-like [Schistocerca serialis cubense]|uniref:sialin-like n=1 Tax=Schistocerca serialis cubense TaxID=2023355 RepID=UPI00214EFBC6|nr:sialin-like [Schistocerca serialis cubense]